MSVSLEPVRTASGKSPKTKSVSPPSGRRVSPPTEPPSTPSKADAAASKEPVVFAAKRSPAKQAKLKKPTDVSRQYVTRIHNKWYDLQGFDHPGGPVARSLVDGRDGTALFVAHHPFTSPSKLDAVLRKYEVSEEDAKQRRLEEALNKNDELLKQVEQISTLMETTESTRNQVSAQAGDLQRDLEDNRRDRDRLLQAKEEQERTIASKEEEISALKQAIKDIDEERDSILGQADSQTEKIHLLARDLQLAR